MFIMIIVAIVLISLGIVTAQACGSMFVYGKTWKGAFLALAAWLMFVAALLDIVVLLS